MTSGADASGVPVDHPDEHPVRWWTAAGLLAVLGVLAVLVRPLAPVLAPVATDLDHFAPAVLSAAADYRSDRYVLGLATMVVSVGVPLLLFATRRGRDLLTRVGRFTRRGPLGGALVAVTVLAAAGFAALPLRYWSGHVLERRWGFATGTVWEWLRDQAIGAGLSLVVAAVAGALFVWVRHRWPRTWPLRLTIMGTGLAALLALAHPLVVLPLLLPTEPLPAGPTRDAVEDVLVRAGEEGLDIAVGDASRRTTRVNAFVTGLGPSRQVVVYDTLLETGPEQVAIVVAHELAHRQHRDIARSVLASAPGLLVGLLLLNEGLRRLGRAGVPAARGPAAVAAAIAFLGVAQVAAAPVSNWVSRRAEAAADHRALELTDAVAPFIATQRGFVVRDLSQPDPPDWVMALWGTHPAVEDRIHAAVAHARRHDVELPTLAEIGTGDPAAPSGP